jgi:hypothetical protein
MRYRLISKPVTADIIVGVNAMSSHLYRLCGSVTDRTQILTVMAGQSARRLLEQNSVWILIRFSRCTITSGDWMFKYHVAETIQTYKE